MSELGPIVSVRVGVSDLARTRAYLRDCAGLKERFANDHIAEFETGGAALVIEPAGDEADERARLGLYTGVMFAVSDAQSAYESLKRRGVDFVGPPEKMFWGGVFAHFRDPDGNIYTACQYPR